MDRRQQTQNSDQTHNLIGAIKALTAQDFTRWMASGIIIRLTPITDNKESCEEFMIAAEDMEQIKTPIIQSIQRSLLRRRIMLKNDLRDIEAILDNK